MFSSQRCSVIFICAVLLLVVWGCGSDEPTKIFYDPIFVVTGTTSDSNTLELIEGVQVYAGINSFDFICETDSAGVFYYDNFGNKPTHHNIRFVMTGYDTLQLVIADSMEHISGCEYELNVFMIPENI